MAEFHSRCVAFENDHTYLKTTYNDQENVQFLQTKMPTIISQDNLVVQKLNIEKKSNAEHITNPTEIVSISPTQSDVLLVPLVNVPLTVNSENITQKKKLTKCKVPVVPQGKFVVKPIKPIKNIIIKDYVDEACTIKLSSILLKRLKNGERLFMCLNCDKIYTEHKDLLEHRKTHKFHKNVFNQEKGVFTNNVQNIKVVEHEKVTFDNNNKTKQSKSSLNPKKQKIVFQGECIMCHSVFPDLGKHLKIVHQSDLNKTKFNHLKYHCHKCDMEFNVKQQLLAHELSAHKNMYTFSCKLCSKSFSHRESLETHIETHNDGMKYLCPYCDAGFPHSNGLRTHLVKHIGFNSHENTTHELLTSPIEYSPTRSPEHLDQLFTELHHISEDTNKVFVEQVADDNYQVRLSMNNEEILDNTDIASSPLDSLLNKSPNINTDLNDEQFVDDDKILSNPQQTTPLNNKNRISYTVCRICMVIVSYSRIGKHMKKKHNNAAPYQCEICYAEFNRKHIMDDHRRKHINNKPHKCTECSKCFTYKHHLNRHMMIVHNADSLEKPFKCSVCDKAFSFKEYLTLHVNSRHKGKHYMCQICGKSFSTNAALNKHQLCHTDERPFMCEHCGRTFKCKTHCDTHKKNMHPGDPLLALPPEKFECDLCNKKFSTKVYRDMHYKRHNGQGHRCNICYKLFVSKAHMQRHIKIMHQN